MFLKKIANTGEEESGISMDFLNKLTPPRDIHLSSKAQQILGGSALLGALLDHKNGLVTGAAKGLGTGAGAWAGTKGGDMLMRLLLNEGKLNDFTDKQKSYTNLGLKIGGGLLGAYLANRLSQRVVD